MSRRFKIIIKCIGLSILLSSTTINAQIFQDTAALSLVKKDINYIYNMQFNHAHEIYTNILSLYPKHPIVFLLKGIMIYWENYPLLHTNSSHVYFEDDMRQCIKLAEANDNPSYEAEYLLASLSARAMLLMFYADNNLITEVTPLTISTYKHIRRAINYTSNCTEVTFPYMLIMEMNLHPMLILV